MAEMVRMRMTGVEPGDYDRVREITRLEEDVPHGLIAHAVSFDDAGMTVFDVWATREDYDRFNEERLGPAMAQAGEERGRGGDVEVEWMTAHNVFTPAEAHAHA